MSFFHNVKDVLFKCIFNIMYNISGRIRQPWITWQVGLLYLVKENIKNKTLK